MANYRDIINGTLNTLAGKVKDVADSTGVRGIYDRGVNRAQSYARVARLSLAINGESEELKKVYTEIGKLYFEQERSDPQGIYAALFRQAEEITARLKEKKDELDAMKAEYEAEKAAEGIEVEIGDFEDIVSATEDEGKGDI